VFGKRFATTITVMKTNSSKKRASRVNNTAKLNLNEVRPCEIMLDELKEMIIDTKRRVAMSRSRIINGGK
jgi:activator of HSP90 ATPase